MRKILDYLLNRPKISDDWAPSLTIAYPNPGYTGRRPWGIISTQRHMTRPRRLALPRLTKSHTALLLSRSVTPDVLDSADWRKANRYLRHEHQEAPTFIALAGVVLGIILLTLVNPGSVFALLAILLPGFALLIAATIAAYRWDRSRCALAHARIFNADTGHRFAVIPLVEDGPIAPLSTLILDVDELALDWQNGSVDDDVWTTSLDRLFAVAEDAQKGAPIGPRVHSYTLAHDHITHALEHIGKTGHVTTHDLTDPTTH